MFNASGINCLAGFCTFLSQTNFILLCSMTLAWRCVCVLVLCVPVCTMLRRGLSSPARTSQLPVLAQPELLFPPSIEHSAGQQTPAINVALHLHHLHHRHPDHHRQLQHGHHHHHHLNFFCPIDKGWSIHYVLLLFVVEGDGTPSPPAPM